MTLRRTIILVAAVIVLLLPAGEIWRLQNPWNCFPFTFDESYFAQASLNWSEGKGYRMHEDSKPFSPSITVGIPMAWGANFFHHWTGEDIAHSARIFVYFCFSVLLLFLARLAYRRERNWIAVPFALWIFGYCLSKLPFGGYFAFGILGEGPALILGALAYSALDRRNPYLAGAFAAAAFLMKPTFLFFLPATAFGMFLVSSSHGIRATLSMSTVSVTVFYAVSVIRSQPFLTGHVPGLVEI